MVLVSQDECRMIPCEMVELVILHKLGKGVEIRACKPGMSDTGSGSWIGNYRDVGEARQVFSEIAGEIAHGAMVYTMPPSLGGKK